MESFFRKGLSSCRFSLLFPHDPMGKNTSLLRGLFSWNTSCNLKSSTTCRTLQFIASYRFYEMGPSPEHNILKITIFLFQSSPVFTGRPYGYGPRCRRPLPFLRIIGLLEFAAKIPPFYRLRGLTDKFILRKAATIWSRGTRPQTLENNRIAPLSADVSLRNTSSREGRTSLRK